MRRCSPLLFSLEYQQASIRHLKSHGQQCWSLGLQEGEKQFVGYKVPCPWSPFFVMGEHGAPPKCQKALVGLSEAAALLFILISIADSHLEKTWKCFISLPATLLAALAPEQKALILFVVFLLLLFLFGAWDAEIT